MKLNFKDLGTVSGKKKEKERIYLVDITFDIVCGFFGRMIVTTYIVIGTYTVS